MLFIIREAYCFVIFTCIHIFGSNTALQSVIFDTFLSFKGHDTTASSIPWILHTLAKHEEYQERVQEEIDNIVEGRDTSDILW